VFHLHRQISIIKKGKSKAGIALNPATNVETIFPILEYLDFVLLMSVNPGYGGQKFLPLVYDKISKIRKYANEHNIEIDIEIDGGVNNHNAPKLIETGATMLVAGSYVFNNADYEKQIKSLR
jgi:ribulose-phosphate 3-epimerase